MFVISWLLTPFGRIIGIAVAGFIVITGLYIKVTSDIRANVEGEITANSMERLNDAVRAGDASRNDPKRVRELDKEFCRDC